MAGIQENIQRWLLPLQDSEYVGSETVDYPGVSASNWLIACFNLFADTGFSLLAIQTVLPEDLSIRDRRLVTDCGCFYPETIGTRHDIQPQ